jgi:predicted small metal-binding protein
MFAGKALRCDCGYEVRAQDEPALVQAIRRHAWEVHGIEFSVELALDVARRAHPGAGEQVELDRNGVIGKEKQ